MTLSANAQKLEGATSIGYIWPADDMDETLSDDEDERELLDPYEHPDNKRLLQLGRDLDADVADTDSTCSTLSRASSSSASSMSLASSTGIPVGVASAADFSVEARLTLERNISENHSVTDTILELKTLMLSSNVGISGPGGGREAVVACLMGLVEVDKSPREIKDKSEQVWTQWGGILAGLNAPPVDSILEVQVCHTSDIHAQRLTMCSPALLHTKPSIRTLLPLLP
jgi:translation initiation factor eIF-2B subunit epsilon